MTPAEATLLVGILASLASIISAALAYNQATKARNANRTDQIEQRLAKADKDMQLLYYWNRELVDHIFQGKPPPPPKPPAGLFDQ